MYIEVFNFKEDKLLLLCKFDLKKYNIFAFEDIYLHENYVYLRCFEDKYIKIAFKIYQKKDNEQPKDLQKYTLILKERIKNMAKKTILIILIIFSHISCWYSRREKMEEMIAGKEYKYWYQNHFYINLSKDTVKYKIVYFGDRKGNFYWFSKYQKNDFTYTDTGDVVMLHTWELIDDSTINLSGLVNKIISLSDTMLIISNEFKDRDTFYWVQDTVVPIAYRILK